METQYRGAVLGGLICQLFFGIVLVAIYRALYAGKPQTMPLSHVTTYVWLQQAFFRMLLATDPELQDKMFRILGFTEERAQEQFGFLMNAFKYGAPPHGGLAYGLDRWVSLFAGLDSIRDCIAFPKNNSGRDVMLDAPARLEQKQLDELYLSLVPVEG